MSKLLFKPFRLALVQLKVGTCKATNLQSAKAKVFQAATEGKANVIVLPECFNSPYGTQYFSDYAEPIPGGESSSALSAMAKEAKVYLVGGSIPEIDAQTGKLYNTCTVYDPNGNLIATHRKVHLFDIDVPGKIRFQESDVLSPGDSLTHADTEYGALGIGICYDMRFPEVAKIAAKKGTFLERCGKMAVLNSVGCVAMIYPGAFNTTTGPLHWELLQRARAVDNQLYVAACSPARDTSAAYQAWGHSSIVDPKGQVVATTQHDEDIVYADLDPEELFSFRQNIPIGSQARHEVFQKYN